MICLRKSTSYLGRASLIYQVTRALCVCVCVCVCVCCVCASVCVGAEPSRGVSGHVTHLDILPDCMPVVLVSFFGPRRAHVGERDGSYE